MIVASWKVKFSYTFKKETVLSLGKGITPLVFSRDVLYLKQVRRIVEKVFCRKGVVKNCKKFCKIHRKALAPESIFS